MSKILVSVSLSLVSLLCFSQSGNQSTEFNFGFEKVSLNEKLPDQWFQWGSGYHLKIDTLVKRSGRNSVMMEPAGEKTPNTFGCIAYSIPANYEGKEIELKAYMKLQNVTGGPIGLLLRIDGASGGLGFDNMMEKNIQGTSDWTSYSVKLPWPEDAKTIFIGAMLSGNGQIWVDDFQVLIDGKSLSKAKQNKQKIFDADKDKEFDNGSTLTTTQLNEAKIEDLALLGKIWGFLKYYHPAIASGEYNWDYELFRILPQVLKARNPADKNKILNEWVGSIGKIEKESAKDNVDVEIKIQPDLSWIDPSILGEDLYLRFSHIKNAGRSEEHYYIGLAAGVGNPVFRNERSYTTMKYPDAGFRLLSLYRYWNMIQYYFPYKNLIEEKWTDVLSEFIPKFINASDELEYKQTVLALIARVHDTHANIWGQDLTLENYRGTNYAPLEISFVENKAVVTGYFNQHLGEQTGLKAGDVIKSINHKTVEDIVKKKLPYSPASNYPTQLRNIAKDLLRTNDSTITIEYLRGDTEFTKQIKCFSSDSINPSQKYFRKDTCYKLLNPEIAYLYPGTIKNEYLPNFMPEILKTKGLIIDLRCYPSAFIVFSLSEYLQPRPTAFVKFTNGSITTPGLFTMEDVKMVGRMNNDYYKGKVVILVNELTQSQAEYTTMAFRTAPKAFVIGSTTAGADGNVSQFYLPGGINTMISGIGVYYPDGTETQRIGIVPDIEIRPTIKGIQEGRDELLEKAIEIINKE